MEAVFDTLKVYERLKGADLSEKAAKEIAEVFRETIEERLVTRQHLDLRLKELEANLRREMAEIKNDTIKWVAAMLVAQAALISALVKLL
ncbi:MAG: DUF1640 domain-containing protein [Nitrospinae bacterium]|nr:DUF1640 domain-containing protein [Nitrospinota bacterium]